MKRSLTYTMLALLAADMLTTWIFGSLGVHEANPLWADAAGAPVMTNVILSHIGAGIFFAYLIQSRGKRLWPYGLICGIFGLVVVWNVAAMVSA